jgi:hypothetical protein
MNAKTITSAFIAAVLGFTLGLPGAALADRDNRGHRQGQHDGGKYRQQRQHKREFKQDKRYDKRRKYSKKNYRRDNDRHYKGNDKKHAKRYYRNDHDRHYKGHKKQHTKRHYKNYNKYYGHRNYGYGGYGGRYYDDDDDDEKLLIGLVVGGILGYALNASQDNDADDYDSYYDRNAYQPNSYSSGTTYLNSDATCLQEREYQTTIIVGGRAVDAYGTACLQPDGSWARGPAQAASY